MKHLTRRRVLASAAATGAAAVAGCLEDSDASGDGADANDEPPDEATGGSGALGDPAETVTVTVVMRPSPQFDPGIVHVEPGGTVRWEIEGLRHSVTAYHPETYGPQRIPDGVEPFDSGTVREGHEFEVTFEEEGIYDYVDTRRLCGSHEALGAVGRVVVGWPDLEGQPALEHDPAELPSRGETVMREYNDETWAALNDD